MSLKKMAVDLRLDDVLFQGIKAWLDGYFVVKFDTTEASPSIPELWA